MSSEQIIFPQAFIAQGNGDLVQVTNFKMTLTNGAKQKHTLRRKGAGFTLGTQESTATFDFEIDENGPERNYWKDCMRGTPRQLRAKIPGGKTVLTINGVYSSVDTDGPLDDATKGSATFIGHMDEPEV
jgi:hypothetical protein